MATREQAEMVCPVHGLRTQDGYGNWRAAGPNGGRTTLRCNAIVRHNQAGVPILCSEEVHEPEAQPNAATRRFVVLVEGLNPLLESNPDEADIQGAIGNYLSASGSGGRVTATEVAADAGMGFEQFAAKVGGLATEMMGGLPPAAPDASERIAAALSLPLLTDREYAIAHENGRPAHDWNDRLSQVQAAIRAAESTLGMPEVHR